MVILDLLLVNARVGRQSVTCFFGRMYAPRFEVVEFLPDSLF